LLLFLAKDNNYILIVWVDDDMAMLLLTLRTFYH